ncbi:MAG: bifunctional aspartate kinase/homoserine dehydrogenase I [Bacteroidota bacterium]
MNILKFGGSSVAKAEGLDRVAKIIEARHQSGDQIAVVVSAMKGMTDMLEKISYLAALGDDQYREYLRSFWEPHYHAVKTQIANISIRLTVIQSLRKREDELDSLMYGLAITRDLTPRMRDVILSFGERISAYILSQILSCRQLPGIFVDARELILTDSQYGAAEVETEETYAKVQAHFEKHSDNISIITGFIGSSPKGITTTLGRGGSDYTASLIGAALGAEEIEIWTDVDGVLTSDPRKVKMAFPIDYLSFEEALEMSHFGARVIYPPTIVPALEKKIPIRIKNTFNPDAKGTLIGGDPMPSKVIAKGITSINDVTLLTLTGSALFGGSSISARLFMVLAEGNINAILITQGSSQHGISLAIRPQDAEKAERIVNKEFELEQQAKRIDPVWLEHDLAVIAVIGDNMRALPGVSAKIFQALGKNGVNVIATAQGSSQRNISVVIRKQDEAKALTAVHDIFFLSKYYTLNLFVVGAGLVGSTLLRQIQEQSAFLKETQYVSFRLVALTNTKKMRFEEEGLPLDGWKDILEETGEPANLPAFVAKMIEMNLPNSVFIDNTASEEPIPYYEEILRNAISISTPNKVAVSGPYSRYQALKELADQYSVKFFYEANVGAGLPVLTTLNDLINSGDRILKIEGILSGSLSFIFNSFKAGMSFSEIVKQAQSNGFTEPDPRIDLSGKDVARKLLILARESGLKLEPSDIDIEQILPPECMAAETADEFMRILPDHDGYFEQLRQEAEAEGKVLRFVATLEGEKAYITLQKLDEESPFYNLSGSDNMIVFTSNRYKDRPLVVKGPGAGAEVTAAGVFAEILRIGYYLS